MWCEVERRSLKGGRGKEACPYCMHTICRLTFCRSSGSGSYQ